MNKFEERAGAEAIGRGLGPLAALTGSYRDSVSRVGSG